MKWLNIWKKIKDVLLFEYWMESINYVYNLDEIDINNWKGLFKYKKYYNFENK